MIFKSKIILYILIYLLYIYNVICANVNGVLGCHSNRSCKDCIRNPLCGWCVDKSFKSSGVCCTGTKLEPSMANVKNACITNNSTYLRKSWFFNSCPPYPKPDTIINLRNMLKNSNKPIGLPYGPIPSMKQMQLLIADSKKLHPKFTAIQEKKVATNNNNNKVVKNTTMLEKARIDAQNYKLERCRLENPKMKRTECLKVKDKTTNDTVSNLDVELNVAHQKWMEAVRQADIKQQELEKANDMVLKLGQEEDQVRSEEAKAFGDNLVNKTNPNATKVLTLQQAQLFAANDKERLENIQKELNTLRRDYNYNLLVMMAAKKGSDMPKKCVKNDPACYKDQESKAFKEAKPFLEKEHITTNVLAQEEDDKSAANFFNNLLKPSK